LAGIDFSFLLKVEGEDESQDQGVPDFEFDFFSQGYFQEREWDLSPVIYDLFMPCEKFIKQ